MNKNGTNRWRIKGYANWGFEPSYMRFIGIPILGDFGIGTTAEISHYTTNADLISGNPRKKGEWSTFFEPEISKRIPGINAVEFDFGTYFQKNRKPGFTGKFSFELLENSESDSD